MNELVSNLHVVLQDARYDTWDSSSGANSVVTFEDDTVMGFVCVFDSVKDLLSQWQATENTMLSRYALRLRGGGEKAWNVYCAFVTHERASDDERLELRWIEEDLERTRKIAAAGLLTREEITTALLPLLPILAKPVLGQEDPTKRLQRRIAVIAPAAQDAALDASEAVEDVVRLLGGT